MIDFHMAPRQSGKTTKMMEDYLEHENDAIIYVPNNSQKVHLESVYGKHHIVWIYSLRVHQRVPKYIYFDEPFHLGLRVDWDYFRTLSDNGHIVKMYGTPNGTMPIWMKKDYPEWFV